MAKRLYSVNFAVSRNFLYNCKHAKPSICWGTRDGAQSA